MNKFNISVVALALIAAGNAAAVSNGDITFNGKVVDNTCTIAPADVNKVVTLPTVNRSALDTAGKETGTTAFDINVTSCPTTGTPVFPTKVAVHFEANGSTGVDPVSGNLTNNAPTATAAKDVQVRLYNYGVTNGFIKVGTTGNYFDVDTSGNATTTYAAGYFAKTDTTTVGDVTAKVLYTLAYQ